MLYLSVRVKIVFRIKLEIIPFFMVVFGSPVGSMTTPVNIIYLNLLSQAVSALIE